MLKEIEVKNLFTEKIVFDTADIDRLLNKSKDKKEEEKKVEVVEGEGEDEAPIVPAGRKRAPASKKAPVAAKKAPPKR
jgi:hypothetical protein